MFQELVQDHHIKTVVSAVFEGGDVLKGNESQSPGHSKPQKRYEFLCFHL